MTILQSRRTVVRAPLIGAIVAYAGPSAPTGWLFCFGQNVSRTAFAQLFGVIGTTFGIGDGSTTFGLPDLRGRFVAGVDAGAGRLTGAQTGGLSATLGAVGGEQGHATTLAETIAHAHNANAGAGLWASGSGTTFIQTTATNTGAHLAGPTTTDNAGSSTAHNNVPPAIALNYMIFVGE
jgi:microcystin-dependent protein